MKELLRRVVLLSEDSYCFFSNSWMRDIFYVLWTALREFGYNNHLEIADDLIPSPMRETSPNYQSDHNVELSSNAIEFLSWDFSLFECEKDASPGPNELEELFCIAPENPFSTVPYKDVAETNASGGLSLCSFYHFGPS